MNRRSFFKFLPVAPVVLIAEGARAATKDQEPDQNILTLIPSKEIQNRPNSLMMREQDKSRTLNLSIGKDGNLWIKSVKDNVWKKLQTVSP